MGYVVKPSLTLFITAMITIALLSVVHALTLEPIERQKQRTQEAAMREVLPQADTYTEIPAEIFGSITAVYEGVGGDGEKAGYVVALSPEGYSGKIDMMVGISSAGETVTGMRVLRHTETPGLGAMAVRESFYGKFDGRSLTPLTVVKSAPGENEIDAITSATITTRAITGAVNEAITWYGGAK